MFVFYFICIQLAYIGYKDMKGSEQNAASVFRELPVFRFLEHKVDYSNKDRYALSNQKRLLKSIIIISDISFLHVCHLKADDFCHSESIACSLDSVASPMYDIY